MFQMCECVCSSTAGRPLCGTAHFRTLFKIKCILDKYIHMHTCTHPHTHSHTHRGPHVAHPETPTIILFLSRSAHTHTHTDTVALRTNTTRSTGAPTHPLAHPRLPWVRYMMMTVSGHFYRTGSFRNHYSLLPSLLPSLRSGGGGNGVESDEN